MSTATKRAKLDLFKHHPIIYFFHDYIKSILILLRYNKKNITKQGFL